MGGNGTTLYIVDRSLCLFAYIDASKVPTKARAEFVALAVRRAAPFPDPQLDIAWDDNGRAAVWYWSKERVVALIDAPASKRQRFSSEATHTRAGQQKQVELLRLHDGVEARMWRDGGVVASRWWQEEPSNHQWERFLKGSGTAVPPSLPSVSPALWTLTPWSGRPTAPGLDNLSTLDQHFGKLALASIAAIIGLAGLEAGLISRALIDSYRAEMKIQSLDAPLQRIIDARDATDLVESEITKLVSLRGPLPPTSLIAEFAAAIDAPDWQLKRFSAPTRETFEATVVSTNLNSEQLIRSLESLPNFAEVSSIIGANNETSIKGKVVANAAHTADSDKERSREKE